MSGPPYSGPSEIKYLFVDGANLQSFLKCRSKEYIGNEQFNIKYEKLFIGYTKVFYYDALPERKSHENEKEYMSRTEAERQLLDKLSSLDGFHVYEGDVRRTNSRRGPEQKKIDVMIAVDMLTHSFRRNMHRATLLTGDLDFKPLIDALVQEGMFVTLWYPPGSTSRELINAADRSMPLNVAEIHASLDDPKPFILPTVEDASSKGEFGEVLWKSNNEASATMVLKHGSNFIVAIPYPNFNGMVRYFIHSDKNILNLYLKEIYKINIMDNIVDSK